MSTNILEELSSITETSDVFIKNINQDGGGFSPFDLVSGGGITTPLAIGCCLTVCIMSTTLICIIHNKSHCR